MMLIRETIRGAPRSWRGAGSASALPHLRKIPRSRRVRRFPIRSAPTLSDDTFELARQNDLALRSDGGFGRGSMRRAAAGSGASLRRRAAWETYIELVWCREPPRTPEIGPDLPYLRSQPRGICVGPQQLLVRKALRVLGLQIRSHSGIRPGSRHRQFSAQCLDRRGFCGLGRRNATGDGQLDFYGIQQLIDRTIKESGEVVIRDRYRYVQDGFHVPYQLQVLEPGLHRLESPVVAERIQRRDHCGRGVSMFWAAEKAYWLFPGTLRDVVKSVNDGFVSRPHLSR